VLLTQDRAQALVAAREAQRAADQAATGPAVQDAAQTASGGANVTGDAATPDGESTSAQRDPISEISPISDISDTDATYHRLRLVIADVPASKIADVNRGIFLPLSNLADGGLTFTLEIDVTSAEGIPQRTLAQTIKETVRQIGARVVAEETE
jgi:hypothetical protein